MLAALVVAKALEYVTDVRVAFEVAAVSREINLSAGTEKLVDLLNRATATFRSC